jgi:kinesin family protein C2/C3
MVILPLFAHSSGNIRVFCRCRPLNTEEIAEGASMAIDFESAKDGELVVRGHVSSKKVFKFDSVFNPEEDQGDSFVNAVLLSFYPLSYF